MYIRACLEEFPGFRLTHTVSIFPWGLQFFLLYLQEFTNLSYNSSIIPRFSTEPSALEVYNKGGWMKKWQCFMDVNVLK